MSEGQSFAAKIPTPPSTNNLFVNGKHGRHKSPEFIGRVEIQLRVPRDGRRDLDNHWKATLDLLVNHRVISDDRLIERLYLFWHDLEEMAGKALLRVTPA